MFSDLPKWVVPVAIFAVFAIMGLVYAWLNRGDDEDDDDDEYGPDGNTVKMSGSHAASTLELPESDELRARKSRMIALKDSLERSLQTRGGPKAAEVDRLSMPWF